MTKTIDEQLERIASAQERQATALEGILEAVCNFKFEKVGEIAVAGVNIEEVSDAGTDDEAATEETATKEAEAPETQEEDVTDDQPEKAAEPEDEAPEEAAGEDGDEGDPLGDGEAGGDDDPYALPEKLTNDTLRGFARDLMEKEGKAAVFEVLAEVGSGYKAVGEVSKDDLQQAHELMVNRLRG